MPGIFISYRRNDSSGHAGRLYDALSHRFGQEHLFMDVDNIPLGENFVKTIEKAIESCDALLVLIGRQWLASTDARGQRRLDDPNDYVRLEIQAAFKRGIRVLPVLIQEASMPSPQDLPEVLAPLTQLQACVLTDSRWRHDVEQLRNTLNQSLNFPRFTLQPRAPNSLFTSWGQVFTLPGAGLTLMFALAGPNPPIMGFAVGLVIFFLPCVAIGKVIDLFLFSRKNIDKVTDLFLKK